MMSESTASIFWERDSRSARRWALTLAGLLAGTFLGAALVPLAQAFRVEPAGATVAPEVVADVVAWEGPPLPREWRGHRKAYTFDHMFRKPR